MVFCQVTSGGVQVPFDYHLFTQQWPEFSYLSEAQGQVFFNLATTYLRNDGSGPVRDTTLQSTLLNMLIAHLAKLFAPQSSGAPATDLVGRVTSATEGTVNVAVDFPMNAQSAWFYQTKYGGAFWEATRAFRTMRYIPGKTRVFDPYLRRIRY